VKLTFLKSNYIGFKEKVWSTVAGVNYINTTKQTTTEMTSSSAKKLNHQHKNTKNVKAANEF
jgi:sarcosine oxidase delta subunit